MANHTQTALIVQCSRCCEWLPLAEFYAEKRSASGYRANCKRCHCAAVKRRADDPGVRLKIDAYQAEYRERHRDRARERTVQYRAANPERVRAADDRCRAVPVNKKIARQRARAFRLANPELQAEYAKRRRARKKSTNIGFITPALLAAKLAYWGNRCWMCRSVDDLQVDHVKPLSKGGAHILANLRPACRACNLAKSDRWPFTPR